MSDIKIKSIKNNRGEEIKDTAKENKKGTGKKVLKWFFILIAVFIIGGIGGVTADRFLIPYLATNNIFSEYDFLKPKETEVIIQEKETVRIEESGAINEAIQKIKPSVVSIIAKEDFDKSYVIGFDNDKYGSGFIVTSDGLIATDSNVINNVDKEYIIITDDGRSFVSKEIYKDPISDITFVKIETDNLPVASFAVSDDLILGQKVISVGEILNNSHSAVSLGIIRSKDMSMLDDLNENRLDGMILTDTEVNSNNSGGPLVDLSGKVCGLNIFNREKGHGYTIPIDYIKKPLDSVIARKEIKRFDLGVKYVKVTPYIAEKENLSKDFGIYLPREQESVSEEGLAYKSGIREGDLIYKVGDFEVRNGKNLWRILEDFSAGEEVSIDYIRENTVNTTLIKLE